MEGKLDNGPLPLLAPKKIPASEFILSTYNPRIAVFSTPNANSIAQKNNLTVTQLLGPFTKAKVDVSWHEPLNGQLIAPKGLKMTLVDVMTKKKVDLDSVSNRKLLQNVVAQSVPTLVENAGMDSPSPWFLAWREQFLKFFVDSQSQQYDYLNHYMACVLVMSSTDGQTPEMLQETVAKLSKAQQQHQNTWSSSWAFPSVLKFYLVLHEKGVSEQERADAMYQSLRTTYGGNFCFMVQLMGLMNGDSSGTDNSHIWAWYIDKQLENNIDVDLDAALNDEDIVVNSDVDHPLSPESDWRITDSIPQNGNTLPHSASIVSIKGQNLSQEDLTSLQLALNEFVNKALLPYIDRQSRILHESIINRRGMSKSFFSATKRLFGGSAKAPSSIVYTNESMEMMSRKLADIYFLFGHYAGSYQLYHQLKKDFLGDAAWIYYASSLEMAAVSHFMMSQVEPPLAVVRAFPVHYINEAITYYIDNCRMPEYALKCALICCDCLNHMQNYSEAAAVYIRMTSEDCDLKSALMLEQAAYAFFQVKFVRKYALHCVLAGHRYSKAGLKTHSLNCYLQADKIYTSRGWRFAEDHVHFTIARLQHSLHLKDNISTYLQQLLVTPTPQPVNQIALFYKEYITLMAKIGTKEALEFFVPKILSQYICVRIGTTALPVGEVKHSAVDEDETDTRWDALEEEVMKDADNALMIFKPTRTVFHYKTDNTVHPVVPSQETFYVDVPLRNPLSVPVIVKNIKLLCHGAGAADSTTVPLLELSPLETKIVRFALKGTSAGSVTFDWMYYELESSPSTLQFKQKITLHGPRLNTTKKERCGRFYAKDLRNRIAIVDKMPLLQASISGIPSGVYHSQTAEFQLILHDLSSDTSEKRRIQDFVLATERAKDLLQVGNGSTVQVTSAANNYFRFTAPWDSDGACSIPFVLHVPSSGEFVKLKVLVMYYFRAVEGIKIHHRVIKLTIKLPLLNCIKLEYSTLKLLNATQCVGLVKAHNLTPDGHIAVTKLCHVLEDRDFKILCNNPVQRNKDGNKSPNDDGVSNGINLVPMESRNIIVTMSSSNFQHETENPCIFVNWELSRPETPIVSGRSKLLMEDLLSTLSLEENSFIFELIHPSSCNNNFNANPCFCFNVELIIHSRISGSFTFKIDKNSSQSNLGPGVKASGEELTLIGQTCWTLDTLPLQTYFLKYTVAVTQPGVFNIAPIITLVSSKTQSPNVPKKYILHSPLIVAHTK